MHRCFSYRPYRREFVNPLRTAHGVWAVREGYLLRFEAPDGRIGYGEVAPIPEFGTETVSDAGRFLKELVANPALAEDSAALAGVPCCAFAVSVARVASSAGGARRVYEMAALLPAGGAAVEVADLKVRSGYRTFKWKVGVGAVTEEQAIFQELLARLPPGGRLRLDVNGGWSAAELEAWLRFVRPYRHSVEYIEQPLPPGEEVLMARLGAAAEIPIALDESLHGPGGARWLEPGNWDGPLVVKPLLMGDREVTLRRLMPLAEQVVLSSAFETACGRENVLALADALPRLTRPLGMDTLGAFADTLDEAGMEDLWKQIDPLK